MTAGTVGSLLAAIAFASFFVAYASSYVICLYLQRYLTLRSPRLVKYFFILLIAVTVTVFAVTMHEHVWSSRGSSGGITSSEIYAGKSYESDTVGNITYVTDGVLKSKSILAIGYAQIGDEYFMVHIDHGNVTAEGKAAKYEKNIARAISENSKDLSGFTGSSLSYDKLQKAGDSKALTVYYGIRPFQLIFAILLIGGPLFLTATDHMAGFRKRCRRRNMMKMKLDDIQEVTK